VPAHPDKRWLAALPNETLMTDLGALPESTVGAAPGHGPVLPTSGISPNLTHDAAQLAPVDDRTDRHLGSRFDERLQDRALKLTGTAPRSREVDENGSLCFQDLGIEVDVVDGSDLDGCHRGTSFPWRGLDAAIDDGRGRVILSGVDTFP
jgi:hypothetical protein